MLLGAVVGCKLQVGGALLMTGNILLPMLLPLNPVNALLEQCL
jgi:hypothetical protein